MSIWSHYWDKKIQTFWKCLKKCLKMSENVWKMSEKWKKVWKNVWKISDIFSDIWIFFRRLKKSEKMSEKSKMSEIMSEKTKMSEKMSEKSRNIWKYFQTFWIFFRRLKMSENIFRHFGDFYALSDKKKCLKIDVLIFRHFQNVWKPGKTSENRRLNFQTCVKRLKMMMKRLKIGVLIFRHL